MAIVKMKHLHLAAMTGNREELLQLMQRMGCVEIDQPTVDLADPIWRGLVRPEMGGASAARERHVLVERAITVLKRYAPEKGGLLQPKPSLTEGQLFDESVAQKGFQVAQEIDQAQSRINAIHTEQAKLEVQRQNLAPWLTLDLPLETASTDQVVVQLGTLPASVSYDQAEGAILAAGDLAQFQQVSENRDTRYCLFMCHASQKEAVFQALKELGWSRFLPKEYIGTAVENDRRLAQEQEKLSEECKQLEEKLTSFGGLYPVLKQLADRTAVELSREEAKGRMLDTHQTFFLEGWVPEERWPKLEQALVNYPCAYEVADPVPEEYPQVPVLLKNNWLTRPLNMVTEMYSLPAYGSLDPNPLMAPFFILFYGIMMADMGYGLLMMLASAVVLTKKKPKGGMAHFFGLLGLCGVSTFVMGAVTGGFFGDFLTQLLKLINPNSNFALPALFTPLDDTMMILVGAMCLGFVQILTGMAISFYKKLRDGQVMDAIWEEVTWWVVFAGLALAILGKTNLVLAVGGVMVIAGPILTQKGFGKITGIFGSLYNHVTGYFGDILSYSRLMALMLAGSVIAQVFNTLGAIPGNVFIFLIISLVGNTLNFALNLLGCYVHDLRLQCLEYFNKFYQDGGKPFRPLDLNTKYYEVVK
ncbi:MAG: V-type ATP synthase subunit I [Lawsonibacter sp.]|jgi:V/A-type H+-transporting ATPase subunit I